MPPILKLTESTEEEIIRRVVYRIVQADYRINEQCYDNPTTRLLELALRWRVDGHTPIADHLEAAAHHVALGGTIASWRTLSSTLAQSHTARVLALRRKRGR